MKGNAGWRNKGRMLERIRNYAESWNEQGLGGGLRGGEKSGEKGGGSQED